MQTNIIDVSTWQEGINWAKVKASGVQGAMLRSSFGRTEGQVDNQFEAHYKGAKAVGLPVGAYHYSYAKNAEQARQEADFFLRTVKGKQFELPVAFDIEDSSQSSLGRKNITDITLAFCEKVEAAGYYVMVYANLNWLENKLDYDRLKRFDIWVAQYYKECQFKKPYGMWQYTSSGMVDGIRGKVDMNWCYQDYPAIIKAKGLNGFDGAKPAPQPVPTPKPQPSANIKVGDTVKFTGGAVYASSDAAKLASNIGGTYSCKVTYTAPNSKHPYHLEGGKVCGWVDASSVSTSSKGAQNAIKKGDKVKVRKGAKTYTGGSIAGFVYQNSYIVDELKGDRAVLDLKGICTPVRVQDLIKQ